MKQCSAFFKLHVLLKSIRVDAGKGWKAETSTDGDPAANPTDDHVEAVHLRISAELNSSWPENASTSSTDVVLGSIVAKYLH